MKGLDAGNSPSRGNPMRANAWRYFFVALSGLAIGIFLRRHLDSLEQFMRKLLRKMALRIIDVIDQMIGVGL